MCPEKGGTVLRLFVRRSDDVGYFTRDAAHELDGLRDGPPGWWLRGEGGLEREDVVAQVLTRTPRASVVGYDIVVAAPRPVSILLALDAEHAPIVVAAHRRSVRASIEYLEERALVVQRQRNGEREDHPARWERVVGFTHGINRHGEPHLHDHVVVGARPQGSNVQLDARSLFAHAQAADALYRSSMRRELTSRTPWMVWRSFKGLEHVAGLDEGYRALWGGHHDDRGVKTLWQRHDVVAKWERDREQLISQGVVEPRLRGGFDRHAFAGAFEGLPTVTRRQVVAAWANAAVLGVAPRELTRTIDHHYPELVGSRGVREASIGVARARVPTLERIREADQPRTRELWRSAQRERSRVDLGRSR